MTPKALRILADEMASTGQEPPDAWLVAEEHVHLI